MTADPTSHLTDRAAANQRAVDFAQLEIAIATEPAEARAWLDDLGLLVSLDLAHHLVVNAWNSVLDLAGDTRLDGNFAAHLLPLHALTL